MAASATESTAPAGGTPTTASSSAVTAAATATATTMIAAFTSSTSTSTAPADADIDLQDQQHQVRDRRQEPGPSSSPLSPPRLPLLPQRASSSASSSSSAASSSSSSSFDDGTTSTSNNNSNNNNKNNNGNRNSNSHNNRNTSDNTSDNGHPAALKQQHPDAKRRGVEKGVRKAGDRGEDGGNNGDSDSEDAAAATPTKQQQRSLVARLAEAVRSRAVKDDLKIAITFTLSFVFVFFDRTYPLLQSRTLNYIAVVVILNNPARTLGGILDSSFLVLVSSLIGALAWTLINTIAGTSNVGMGCLLFLATYLFSYARALSPRLIALGIFGPLLAYTACTSALGLSGPNTTNGDVFDSAYLVNVLYAIFIGVALCLVVNTLVFPTSAEHLLKQQVSDALKTLSELMAVTLESFSRKSASASRSALAKSFRDHVTAMSAMLVQADSEIFFSEFNLQDYESVVNCLNAMAAELSAIDTALVGHEEFLFQSDVFKVQFCGVLHSRLDDIKEGVTELIEQIAERIQGLPKAGSGIGGGLADKEAKPRRSPTDVVEAVHVAVSDIERRQFDILFRIFEHYKTTAFPKAESPDSLERGSLEEEGLWQVNFFTLGIIAVVQELEALQRVVFAKRTKSLHFRYRHFLPTVSFKVSKKRASLVSYLRPFLARASKELLSLESIFAAKCATAVVIVFILACSQPDFYRRWNIGNSFVTLIMAIGPSLGQTHISFVTNLVGSSTGNLWAYISLMAFVNNTSLILNCSGWGCDLPTWVPSLGLSVMSFLIALVMGHVMLRTKFPVFGILAMLAFAGNVNGLYVTRLIPGADSPTVRFYKLLASLTMALCFALIFSLAIYPNLARHNLRVQIANILRLINAQYTDVTSVSFTRKPSHKRTPLPAATILRLRTNHRTVQLAIAALEPLMTFAAAEVRVEGRFQAETYREIITRMRNIMDRLASAIVSLGGHAFDKSVQGLLSRRLRQARKEMHNTICLLLSLFASAMISKHPIPHELPQATRARNRAFREYQRVMTGFLSVHDEVASYASAPAAVQVSSYVSATPAPPTLAVDPSAGGVAFRRILTENQLRQRRRKRLSGWTAPATAQGGAGEWESGTAGVGEVGEDDDEEDEETIDGDVDEISLPTTIDEVKEIIRSESWLRFFSYALAARMISVEVDALVKPTKALFGELPSLAYRSEAEVGAVPAGKRGHETRSFSPYNGRSEVAERAEGLVDPPEEGEVVFERVRVGDSGAGDHADGGAGAGGGAGVGGSPWAVAK
ncbi:hypothetical protein DFJ73DRAFT_794465 [Zopfochytrium polystomum]|nr:hypothetical protein DFJ73DRAFT_794465 [Zopfochytrium polystomum]